MGCICIRSPPVIKSTTKKVINNKNNNEKKEENNKIKKDAEDKLKEEENNNSVNGDENKNKIIKNPILRKYYNQLKNQKNDEKMKLIEDDKHLKNKFKNESKEKTNIKLYQNH